jgi:hypothetical protein
MTKRGAEWDFYLRDSKKKNSRNYWVWCKRCVEYEKSRLVEENKDGSLHGALLLQRAKEVMEKDHPGKFTSKKEVMVNHVIECKHASAEDKAKAWAIKRRRKVEGNVKVSRVCTVRNPTMGPVPRPPKPGEPCNTCGVIKRQDTVQSKLAWTVAKDFGMSNEEAEQFALQLARATVSAGLPETWIEDPEIIKAFAMIRPAVPLPRREQLQRLVAQLRMQNGK